MSKLFNLDILKKHKIKLLISVTWVLFFYLNWITYTRFIAFLIVLEFILIYRIIIKHIESTDKLKIKNKNILNFIIKLNKYRSPVLLLLIKWDVLMYNLIIYYNNKILNALIYLIYVLLINPIKILYFKFYMVLFIWKTNKIWNLLFSRMFGLILSILIFTNIINYMTNTLHLNILIIIYIYGLIISISCEVIEIRENKILKIILVNHINTWSVIANKLEVNILSIILKKNKVDELSYYFNEDTINKIEQFKVGYMWLSINSLIFIYNRPDYNLYVDLWYVLEKYLTTRIDNYIFFQYYNWNVLNINLLEVSAQFDIKKLKAIYDYDYKVFKVLLFLYWDLEYYLEDITYVQKSLVVDFEYTEFLRIKFSKLYNSDIIFLNKIKYKDKKSFWSENIFNLICKYDMYSKMYSLDKTYKNDSNIEHYKLYESFHLMVSYDEITLLKELQNNTINPIYYQEYIDTWYKEWYSEINIDLSLKYKKKINELEQEYYFLLKLLQE